MAAGTLSAKTTGSVKATGNAYKPSAVYTENGFTVDRISAEKDDDSAFQSALYAVLKEKPYSALYEQAFLGKSGYDVSVRFLVEIAMSVARDISRDPDVNLTRSAPEPPDETLLELLRAVPFVIGYEFVSVVWIKNIYIKIADVFTSEFVVFADTAEEYFKAKNSELNAAGRVFFHLVEHKDEEYPFAFLATYAEGEKDHVRHVPLKNALEQNKKKKDGQETLLKLLSAVSRAADRSEFISELVESGELFSPLRFTPEEAYTFLKETPLYEECGVICRIPNFWKRKSNARLKVSVGSKEPAALGLDALMAFTPEIYLGDERFSRAEIEALLSETGGLAFLKGKWVEADPSKLQSILKAFDEIDGKDISLADAIRMQSGLLPVTEEDKDAAIEVTNGEWLTALRAKMTNPAAIEGQRVSASFLADLRGYQMTGFNWLNFMVQSRFGALLADDMGLGKTVQVLALLDFLRGKKIRTLLVIPASLIQNWEREARRFAPELTVMVLHGGETDFSPEEADLFITTYGMVPRIEKLSGITWDLLVLDEAQAIKNHGNKQTAAVKKLDAKGRIAMTGAPVENRLSDLWSLFDFLNKGLLGSQKEFTAFSKSLKDDTAGYQKLRGAVSPFILRRLKTDKSIIGDLPDKSEIKQYTTLSKKQVALYNNLVQELERVMEEAPLSGIERKGVVLASIMKFKQICNHPDQYLGAGEFAPKFSGKFETLEEICRIIRDKRERALIFTQFREMTKPLADFLAEVFEREGLILHGGTPVKKRGELVEQFNGEEYAPFMVLSLKAGGVGLNLTGANHVIHFDRWWNPAVENQATDRAFRIGQKKNVMVYKFITAGTVEEKIDAIIESKQKLAGDVIAASSGESWITEMSNEDLFNLFRLEA